MGEISPSSQIKRVLQQLPRGRPISVDDLAGIGVSAKDASRQVRLGTLERMGHGVYRLPGEVITADQATIWLQARVEGLHVGGRSALARYGVRHAVGPSEALVLWADRAFTVPKWFREAYRARGVGRGLFDWASLTELSESAGSRGSAGTSAASVSSIAARAIGTPPGAPEGLAVAAPERATLELLYEVGRVEALDDARLLFEGLRPPRLDVLGALLSCCTSVKAVRLYLTWARAIGLIDVDALAERWPLRVGSDRRWINRLADGTLLSLKTYG